MVGTGPFTYTLDALGRQSGQTDAAGFVQAYGYDPNGNRTGLNLVGTGLFTYTFDSLNRIATAMKPGNALYTMAYDADSRRTTMMLGNGSIRKYVYDSRSQLTTQVELNAANVPIVTLIDSYDAVGNRMTRSVNGTVSTWAYDDLYRLTGQMKPGQVATYTLDGVGNLKVMWEGGSFPKTFTVDAADKIVTMVEGATLTTYTHTGYGALASEVTGNSTTAYSYSGQDHLVGITDPNGVRSTYSFSGDGLRRTVQNGNVLPTTMVWNGSDYLLLNEPGANQVVLTLRSEIVACGNIDLLPDSLGSIIGDIRAGFDPSLFYEYMPYGKRADGSGAAPFPFLFVGASGYYNDNDVLAYVRARELYELLGSWVQVDPLWPTSLAATRYSSRPVTESDPTGELLPIALLLIGMALGAATAIGCECSTCKNQWQNAADKTFTEEFGNLSKKNDFRNALQHCNASCEIHRHCGQTCWALSWQIREGGAMAGNLGSLMDCHNNIVGAALSSLPGSCLKLCQRFAAQLIYEKYPGKLHPNQGLCDGSGGVPSGGGAGGGTGGAIGFGGVRVGNGIFYE